MTVKFAPIVLALAAALPAHAQDPARTLHDTYCLMCHGTQVYTRPDRLAGNYDEIRAQVDRWQGNASLRWTPAQIDLVTTYLARHFYRMPCPMDC